MVNQRILVGLLLTALLPVSFAANGVNTSSAADDSFAQMEALDQHVEQASKQIDALKVTQQLKELQDKANRMSMDFSVLRITGIDYQLSAMLQFNNKTMMTVKTGDVIENQFRVTAITPNAVHVYDATNQITRVVPFA